MHTVFVREYNCPDVDAGEVLRYAGVKKDVPITDQTRRLLEECINEVQGRLLSKVCFAELELRGEGDTLDLGFASVRSASLAKRLQGCDKIIVFAASVGLELDRLIARYSVMSPARALMLGAIGNERIEALCDAFCADVQKAKAAEGRRIRPRFSAGYGDLSLEVQKDIFSLLHPQKHIGLSLNQSLLMSPSKSVTAIVGIESEGEK